MAIFLDYFKPRGEEVTVVAVRENSVTRFYRYRSIPDVISELAGREMIIVFEKPFQNLQSVMLGYEHLIEDHQIKKRWYDLHKVLRQETGKALSLSKVTDATLGFSENTRVSRLDPSGNDAIRFDIEKKLETRLNALEGIYEYALKYNQLSYLVGKSTEWIELNINENIELD